MNNYILQNENAVFYECGYSCNNELFLKIGKSSFFITDSRYAIEAREKLQNTEVIEITTSLLEEAKSLFKKLNIKEIIFDPNDFTYSQFTKLAKDININFIETIDFSKKKRIIKSEKEIDLLKKASKFGENAFSEFASFLKNSGTNLSEMELFYEASLILKNKGKLGLSFEPIIALNKNSAKAHALPGSCKLQYGDLVLFDAGVRYEKYCSDRTRTAYFDENLKFDKKQNFKDSKKNEIYEIVKEAQSLAIKSVKPGMLAKDIDFVARNFIAKQGYAKEFFHGTGHGVGIDIHELPNINSKSEIILEEGMVFSIEPGIYIDKGFGVRIEDVVVVTKDGSQVL